MSDIIKKDTVEEIQEQQPKHTVQLPKLKDYAYEREQQLIAQRLLYEKLNFKRYKKNKSLAQLMQELGDNYRSGGIVWWFSLISFFCYFLYGLFEMKPNRRDFLKTLLSLPIAATLDVEKLLWVPDKKIFFIPSPRQYLYYYEGNILMVNPNIQKMIIAIQEAKWTSSTPLNNKDNS